MATLLACLLGSFAGSAFGQVTDIASGIAACGIPCQRAGLSAPAEPGLSFTVSPWFVNPSYDEVNDEYLNYYPQVTFNISSYSKFWSESPNTIGPVFMTGTLWAVQVRVTMQCFLSFPPSICFTSYPFPPPPPATHPLTNTGECYQCVPHQPHELVHLKSSGFRGWLHGDP